MKRPLAVILTLLIAGWTFLSAAGDDSGSPPFDTEQLLYQEVGEGQEMTVSGTVASCSVISSGVRLFIDSVSVLSENHSTISFLPEQKITVMTSDTSIMPGDVLVLRGTFAPFLQAGNPGQFDFRNWYFRQNTVCTMKDVRILQRQEGEGRLQEQLYRFRRMIWSSYEQILPEKAAATIAAISMGEKGLMEAEWKTQYQEGGIAHIIAVSGLHITMIGMSIYRFLRWIYLPISVSAVLSGGVTILYGLLTGSGISAMRAVLMFLIWLGAQICGRKYDQITGIAIAAAVLILPDVQVLQESSFWLSFLAVLTLASLVPFMQKSCGIRTGAGEALCSSIGIWIGMLPVTLYFFYQAVPWSMLVNLVVIPLMSSVMGAGIISAVAGLYSKSLGVFLGAPVQYLLQFFDFLCEIQQKLPGAVWIAGRPVWSRILLYYGVLAMVILAVTGLKRIWKKKPRQAKAGCVTLWLAFLLLGSGILEQKENGSLIVTCLDVGQGDGAIVQLPDGTNCLIDCGSSSESNIWTYRAGTAVKYYGIDTLDYAFLSHGDQDHVSGLLEFLENYECGLNGKNIHGITLKKLVLPVRENWEEFEELIILAQKNGIPVIQMEAGAEIGTALETEEEEAASLKWKRLLNHNVEEDWNITCLAPDLEGLTGDGNQDSMVLMLQYGKFRMLFTGDLEGEAEEALTGTAENLLDADVLKVGHHGSKNASSEAFLGLVTPETAVISCGRNNSYGHPAAETLERLEQSGAHIFNTAEIGAVRIISDGETFQIYTFLKKK